MLSTVTTGRPAALGPWAWRDVLPPCKRPTVGARTCAAGVLSSRSPHTARRQNQCQRLVPFMFDYLDLERTAGVYCMYVRAPARGPGAVQWRVACPFVVRLSGGLWRAGAHKRECDERYRYSCTVKVKEIQGWAARSVKFLRGPLHASPRPLLRSRPHWTHCPRDAACRVLFRVQKVERLRRQRLRDHQQGGRH